METDDDKTVISSAIICDMHAPCAPRLVDMMAAETPLAGMGPCSEAATCTPCSEEALPSGFFLGLPKLSLNRLLYERYKQGNQWNNTFTLNNFDHCYFSHVHVHATAEQTTIKMNYM